MRMRTREGFSDPESKGRWAGWVTKGCGRTRRFCFARQAQSLRLTDDPEGLAKQKR